MSPMSHRVLALSLALGAGTAAHAVAPIGISVGAGVQAQLGAENIILSDAIAQAWSGPTSLSIDRIAVAGDGDPLSVTSFARVDATWESARAGTIEIDWGWDVASEGSDLETAVRTGLAPLVAGWPANWSYSFTATRDGAFVANWTQEYFGESFGLNPLRFNGLFLSPDGGTLVVPLVAGETYALVFHNLGNAFSPAGFDRFGETAVRLDWSILLVPEPATWAMMIAGFGLVGATLRRRRFAAA